jgi:anion-transporting  ArsA/GET3 family ATPase
VAQKRLIVVCGPGGVGKTTTSAALGLAAARLGRRALVLTIDPAHRLGEALGESGLGNDPQRVPVEQVVEVAGSGALHALMLDQERTADELIRRFAPSAAGAKRVLENRIYRFLSGALASTEYTAVERLHQLYSLGEFDLCVLDTPPSRNALDFLDSPQWAARFLDRKIVEWFLRTARPSGAGGVGAQVMHRTAMVLADLLGRLLGRHFYDEMVEFLDGFVEIAEHLRQHSREVDAVLHASTTTFFIATSPERGAIEEAIRLARALAHRGLSLGGFIANRVEEPIRPPSSRALEGYGEAVGAGETRLRTLIDSLDAGFREQLAVRARDEAAMERLGRAFGGAVPIHQVPRLGDDLTGLLDLARFASCLTGSRCEPTPVA